MLEVRCKTCGAAVITSVGADPDGQLECACCPEDHNHAGRGCRPVHITMLTPAQVKAATPWR